MPGYHRLMPIYEFRCETCGARFEGLVAAGTEAVACPNCGAEGARRILSPQAPTPALVKSSGERRAQERRNAQLRQDAKRSFKAARERARAQRDRAHGSGAG